MQVGENKGREELIPALEMRTITARVFHADERREGQVGRKEMRASRDALGVEGGGGGSQGGWECGNPGGR